MEGTDCTLRNICNASVCESLVQIIKSKQGLTNSYQQSKAGDVFVALSLNARERLHQLVNWPRFYFYELFFTSFSEQDCFFTPKAILWLKTCVRSTSFLMFNLCLVIYLQNHQIVFNAFKVFARRKDVRNLFKAVLIYLTALEPVRREKLSRKRRLARRKSPNVLHNVHLADIHKTSPSSFHQRHPIATFTFIWLFV